MQYKVTYRDVKQLIKWGEQNETVKRMVKVGLQPPIFQTSYYTPSQANWSYQIGIANINGKNYELLTRFGSVEGGREIFIPTDSVATN